ncbi:cysteine peptidase, putative [Bodo saltans]|uniref:Cysteine peptidase, putative n=1 Tax=Bodo saltans TaxID=75058 RepID=A0A0S4KJA5_BODSA|nr:cysteine peptidase, putative [Bodo saltans]|eukprot:CUI14619.1 cysteine peptidase, putative [Bodo saltans]
MARYRTLLCALIAFAAVSSVSATTDALRASFESFKAKHGKSYATPSEETYRLTVFAENIRKAEILNAKNPQARFGASPFADMTETEFKSYHNGDKYFSARVQELKSDKTTYYPRYTDAQVKAAPTNKDWRTEGAVTAVKNQGQCGSCWAFSTTGGVEGQWQLAGNTLVSLSEQQLVSCDTVDSGCNGGLMNNAYEWILANKGGEFVSEASYPYVSGGGTAPACDATQGTNAAKITGHYNIYHDEDQMKAWIGENGPLSLAIDASAWQMYMGGVMTTCGGSALDHGVLIVGYQFENQATPYWIFKNSWGASWGEAGYIYVAFGSDQCLLTHYPVTAIVKGSTPPPTPLPTSSYFVHSVYDDAACTVGGQAFVWEQNTCVAWDGVSFKASCSGSTVSITAYYNSLTCTGQSEALTEETNTCVQKQSDFDYYTNKCVSGSSSTVGARKARNSKAALSNMVRTIKALRKK